MPRVGEKMTEEQKEALRRGRQAKRDALSSIVLRVGEWRVFQLDEYNWTIQRGEDENNRRYYPDLPVTLMALYDLRLGEKAGRTLESMLDAVKAVKSEILAELQKCRF